MLTLQIPVGLADTNPEQTRGGFTIIERADQSYTTIGFSSRVERSAGAMCFKRRALLYHTDIRLSRAQNCAHFACRCPAGSPQLLPAQWPLQWLASQAQILMAVAHMCCGPSIHAAGDKVRHKLLFTLHALFILAALAQRIDPLARKTASFKFAFRREARVPMDPFTCFSCSKDWCQATKPAKVTKVLQSANTKTHLYHLATSQEWRHLLQHILPADSNMPLGHQQRTIELACHHM